MGFFAKMFPPIEAQESITTSAPMQQAHDRVLNALTAAGFFDFDFEADARHIHAKHGEPTFVYGTVSTDISVALTASPSELYPITIDITFTALTDSSTKVDVHAKYIRPVTFAGAPRGGPMAKKWKEACAAALETVRASLVS